LEILVGFLGRVPSAFYDDKISKRLKQNKNNLIAFHNADANRFIVKDILVNGVVTTQGI